MLEMCPFCCSDESISGEHRLCRFAAVSDRSPVKKPFILMRMMRKFIRAGRLKRNITSIKKSPRNVMTSFR
jgi:hypothetical protein